MAEPYFPPSPPHLRISCVSVSGPQGGVDWETETWVNYCPPPEGKTTGHQGIWVQFQV